MERGGSSNPQRRHVNPRSSLAGVVIREAAGNNRHEDEVNNPCKRANDQYMPIANVIRIMRKILPPHAKIADDAKETVQECVSEFISFVTSEANERCHREQRKTVNAEDVLWAMGKLGFDNYVEPLTLYLNRYRQHEIERTSVRGEPIVMRTVDFGQGQPQAQAQPQTQAQHAVALPPMMNYPMGFPIAPPPHHHHHATLSSYYANNPPDHGHAGGSSSSNAAYGLPGFDPNAQFK